MISRRRQNTSCDPCRRVKRRCFFAPLDNAPGETRCVNCQHHNRSCTFEFAASKTTKTTSNRRGTGLERSLLHSPSNVLQADEGFASGLTAEPATPDQDVWASWLDMDAGQDSHENNQSTFSLVDPSLIDPANITGTSDDQLTRTRERPAVYISHSMVGSSPNSPIYLLNTKVDATILEGRLSCIHNAIVTGCASRFVDFECNLYATASRYQLGDEHSPQSSGLSTPAGSAEKELAVQVTPSRAGFQMTSLGVVRFLDHFGGLYGNRLSQSDKKLSAKALKAVLRAFSMQWLSTESGSMDSLNNAYHDTWFEARSILQSAQSIKSFRIVYAILLFDGIAIPGKPKSPHEFLNTGLEHLQYLQSLVNEYCGILGPHSTYSALLEASLSVVSWAGYIRDIGAALTGSHSCKLPSASHTKASQDIQLDAVGAIHQDLDDIPGVCRRAVAQAFYVWRQIVRVKESLNSAVSLPEVVSTITAVEEFNQTFRPFMNRCIESLEHLSTGSKASSVSITLFWDLSVLILAESIDPDLISQIQSYRLEAISSVTKTAQRLLSLVPEEAFNLQNGLRADVPIISYHITPSLTATTFEKAIEAMIDIHLTDGEQDNLIWKQQIDTLMKSLASLDVTVGGEQVTKAAFSSLLRRHGDVLSECWTDTT
ncbi:hypothetical protein ASPVEDRAFT_154935 [Aspergillus versicolor CBS 583.65]|uniref:Zn(2)-C6 fungal-type domain-containing protein n=1 Tax=Aspergillus versicolor CBS 583.65 TaxID=1036611 RepID=A0A1L9PZS5_ASPVE|nr:uncharacterized protein ASPVEDRAFT_154935 [Aspergillus versicolor CBS 583.65]OJJ07013.1 hypothetical protein ASPVEDRAFT_154935 [Aspergillus versicolor CBS 583.65]